MASEKVVPFTTKEGYEYLIGFSPFSKDVFPYEGDVILVDLVISLVNEGSIEVNNLSSLFQIIRIIKTYLKENDVILYCYCDRKEIFRNKYRQKMSAQQFRSLLFSSMFTKNSGGGYINEVILITDAINGDHYMHLIAHESKKDEVKGLRMNLEQLGQKP